MESRTDEYADQPLEETLQTLGSDASHGLSDSVAKERLEQVGYNEIQEKEESLWHRIFRRFWGPIPWMIEIAAILSALVQKWEDFIIILVMLLANALKQGLAGDATVLWDGEYKTVPFRELVTGDNLAIAREIGGLLGLEQRIVRSAQISGAASNELMALAEVLTTVIYQRLKEDVSIKEAKRFASEVMSEVGELYDTRVLEREFIHTHESAIIEMIEEVDNFAEVVPEDKYRIIDILQKGDHIVAMTEDGVNDAPALKKADCGFAVSNATDAARAAADIIHTAPGLSVINEALRQARITFARMTSYTTFRIAETVRIILFMTLSIIVFEFYPITALMIILLALLNDIPILAIAYDNTKLRHEGTVE